MRLDEVSLEMRLERRVTNGTSSPDGKKTKNAKNWNRVTKTPAVIRSNIFKGVSRHPQHFLERGFIPVLATSFHFSTHRDLARFCSFLKSRLLTEQRVQRLQFRTSSPSDGISLPFLSSFHIGKLRTFRHYFLRESNFTSSNTAVTLNFTAKKL